MKHIVFSLTLLALATGALAQSTETETLTASVTIEAAQPSCNISTGNMDFGGLTRPSSGSASATLNPTATTDDGIFTYNGPASSGTPSLGTATVTATNVDQFSTSVAVTSTPATSLNQDASCTGTCSIPYSLAWAGSDDSTGPFTTQTGTDSQTGLGGEGSNTTRYYRLGGTLSGIQSTNETGTYTATLTVTVTCGS